MKPFTSFHVRMYLQGLVFHMSWFFNGPLFQVHISAVLADVPAAAGRAEPRLHLLLPLQPHDHGRGLRHHQAGRLRPPQRPPGIGGSSRSCTFKQSRELRNSKGVGVGCAGFAYIFFASKLSLSFAYIFFRFKAKNSPIFRFGSL